MSAALNRAKFDVEEMKKLLEGLQAGGDRAAIAARNYRDSQKRELWSDEQSHERGAQGNANAILKVLGSPWVVHLSKIHISDGRVEQIPLQHEPWSDFGHSYWQGCETLEEATLVKMKHKNECNIIEGSGEVYRLRLENEKLKAILKTISRQTRKFEKLVP